MATDAEDLAELVGKTTPETPPAPAAPETPPAVPVPEAAAPAAETPPAAPARSRGGEGPSRAKALLLLLPGCAAAGLGAWQLQRREWKAEQLAERAQQLAAEPLPLAAVAASGGARVGEWRRVLCKGELRHDAAAYVRHPADAPLRPPTWR
jgi:hypothetical protein